MFFLYLYHRIRKSFCLFFFEPKANFLKFLQTKGFWRRQMQEHANKNKHLGQIVIIFKEIHILLSLQNLKKKVNYKIGKDNIYFVKAFFLLL